MWTQERKNRAMTVKTISLDDNFPLVETLTAAPIITNIVPERH
jgi:hypothetical protein